MGRRRPHRRLAGVSGRVDVHDAPLNGAKRRTRGCRRSAKAGGETRPETVVQVPIVDLESHPNERAIGEQLDEQARVDPAQHFPPRFEGGDQRTTRQTSHRDRTATRRDAVARRRAVRVRVTRVARVFEAEQVAIALVAPAIDERQRAVRLEHHRDEPILEHASAHAHVFTPRKRHRRAGGQRVEPKARHGRGAERDPHLIDLILIRVMTRGVRSLLGDPPGENLDRDRSPVRSLECERPVTRTMPWQPALCRGPTNTSRRNSVTSATVTPPRARGAGFHNSSFGSLPSARSR